tara:strand:+ start:1082 stop:1426 length:345 start_codon:yes stop_codon:yes gene_type:complete
VSDKDNDDEIPDWEEEDGIFESFCERCGFHWCSPNGEGPVSGNESHGDWGWINDMDFEYEMYEIAPEIDGPDFKDEMWFKFHEWLESTFSDKKWGVICGDCRDNLYDEWNNLRG